MRFFVTSNVVENPLSDIFDCLNFDGMQLYEIQMDYKLTEPAIFRMMPLWEDVEVMHPRDIEKSQAEIARLASEYYSHLSNQFLETIRLWSMPKKELLQRVTFKNPELLAALKYLFSSNTSYVGSSCFLHMTSQPFC